MLFVQRLQRHRVELVGSAVRAQPGSDRGGTRLDVLRGGENALQPRQQFHRRCTRRGLEPADLSEVLSREAVCPPVHAIGEDADVPLSDLLTACADVPRKLLLGVNADGAAAQVLLRLDDGEANLDVDAASVADLRLHLDDDLLQVVVAEVEAAF